VSDERDEQARRAKIARLKKQIADGTYEVDADAVAERMLADDALKQQPASPLDDDTLEMSRASAPSEDDSATGHGAAEASSEEGDEQTDDTELAPGDDAS
jgi:hypothetical protein